MRISRSLEGHKFNPIADKIAPSQSDESERLTPRFSINSIANVLLYRRHRRTGNVPARFHATMKAV